MQVDVKGVKIFVTLPVNVVDEVRNAVCKVGAGVIGNYAIAHFRVMD